jgi:hypothetical protein
VPAAVGGVVAPADLLTEVVVAGGTVAVAAVVDVVADDVGENAADASTEVVATVCDA